MAYIPDEAVDKMNELSAGAWRLFCFLARCRNQKTGKCCPSVQTTAEAIDTHAKNVFKLRKELVTAGWARFDGNEAFDLFGFSGSKNTTTDVPTIEVTEESRKNTTLRVVSSKNTTIPTPVVAKTLPLVAKILPESSKNTTAIYEEPAKEPANRTSKGKARRLAAVPPAVAFVRGLLSRYPDKTLWPRIVKTLGEDFDGERLTECYENWVSHGWNKMNFVWLFEWYVSGVPEGRNGNGRNQVAHRETHNERAARETAELIAAAFAAPGGDSGPDAADANAPWLAADFSRL